MGGDSSTLVLEPAIELPSGLPGARFRVHGRLILTAEALYFIHGWDQQVRTDLWWIIERNVRADASAHAGREMLAKYASHPPQRQAEIVPSSRVLALAELSSARLVRWPLRLIIETRRHGDTLIYQIPRASRASVAQWIATSNVAGKPG